MEKNSWGKDVINVIGDDKICLKINRYLHRYYSVNADFMESLSENYLWFSDPMGFNDPYDCNMEVCCDGTFEEVLNYLYGVNQVHNHPMTSGQLLERAGFLAANPNEMERLSKIQDQKTVSNLGVCCLSERKDSLLMWSHYADKYQGICLTFDITKDRDLFGRQLFAVEYPAQYPIHRFPAEVGAFSMYRLLVATKSSDWVYESEIRLVRFADNPPYRGKVPFNKSALVSVTFGHKCSPQNKKEIIELLHKTGGYEHVKFYSTNLSKLVFGVEFLEI